MKNKYKKPIIKEYQIRDLFIVSTTQYGYTVGEFWRGAGLNKEQAEYRLVKNSIEQKIQTKEDIC